MKWVKDKYENKQTHTHTSLCNGLTHNKHDIFWSTYILVFYYSFSTSTNPSPPSNSSCSTAHFIFHTHFTELVPLKGGYLCRQEWQESLEKTSWNNFNDVVYVLFARKKLQIGISHKNNSTAKFLDIQTGVKKATLLISLLPNPNIILYRLSLSSILCCFPFLLFINIFFIIIQ